MSKIIISCAITGSIHTPSMSPNLPVTADQIADQAIGAAAAGAAILHLHARNPDTGQPSSDPAHWAGFLPRIAAATDAVVNKLSDGGVEVTLQGSGCVTRWNTEAAMTYASEGTEGCSDSQIAAAKTVAIANIPNL